MKKIKGPMYWRADKDIHNIVYKVLHEKRPEIEQLDPDIIVIWKDVAEFSGGKVNLANIRKVSEKDRITYDSTADFILQISSNTWQTLNELQREALIFHELLHIDVKELDGTFILVKHGLEEFSEVVSQYGFYKNDVQIFAETVLKTAQYGVVEKKPVKRYRLNR